MICSYNKVFLQEATRKDKVFLPEATRNFREPNQYVSDLNHHTETERRSGMDVIAGTEIVVEEYLKKAGYE